MRLLLDTHAFLWFIAGDAALSRHARQLIEEPDNERFLSIASLWEMAIKISLGKLEVAQSISDLVTSQVHGNAIQLLEISPRHLDALAVLPFHHRDPFDRLLAVQSVTDDIPVISRDAAFDSYSAVRIWDAPPRA